MDVNFTFVKDRLGQNIPVCNGINTISREGIRPFLFVDKNNQIFIILEVLRLKRATSGGAHLSG